MAFARMDEGSTEDWQGIRQEVYHYQRQMPDRITQMLRSLRELRHGFAIDQLAHSLQTATRAARDGAAEEIVMAALCHDLGKTISMANHPAIGAEILRPYVSEETCWVLMTHQDFQGRFYFQHFGGDPQTYLRHQGHPAFDLGLRFSAWDQEAFDPAYDTFPLEHFAESIDRFFAAPRAGSSPGTARSSGYTGSTK